MADYNIYIHAFSGESSATTPFQLKEGGEGANGEYGFQATEGMKKTASFINNPGSALAAIKNTAIGTVGIAALVIKTVLSVSDKIITTYHSFSDPSSGDYRFSISYGNFKRFMNIATNPMEMVSTLIGIEKEKRLQMIENARNEQSQLLLGGTIYNERYGRYL